MLVILFSLFLVLFFSVLLLFSGDLVMFWVLIEVSGLCLVPCFFVGGVLNGLLSYLIISSLSSVFLVMGLIFPSLIYFFEIGLMLKFGLFPFFGWLYTVLVLSSDWIICWSISILLKFPLVYLTYFLWGLNYNLCVFLVCISLLLVGFFFWVNSYNWFYVWTHMMISSSVLLFIIGLCGGLDLYLYLLLVYFLWGSGTICYLSCFSDSVIGYVLWLLAVPLSFSLYYKVFFCYALCGVGGVLVIWFIYSILEQFYLFKWLISSIVPKLGFGFTV